MYKSCSCSVMVASRLQSLKSLAVFIDFQHSLGTFVMYSLFLSFVI